MTFEEIRNYRSETNSIIQNYLDMHPDKAWGTSVDSLRNKFEERVDPSNMMIPSELIVETFKLVKKELC
mgnify:CR=1 FL=1